VSLRLFSEPYGQMGNIGENLRKLLGAPSTDPLQTAIREALQNIADAAKLGCGPRILIRLRRLSDRQRAAMEKEVFRELPALTQSADLLARFLNDSGAFVLEICDFNTVGLGGPTRADEVPEGTRCTDFADFMLNVGSPRDTVRGGGTYGFGKTALYRVSRCTALIVDTLPSDPQFPERRLMACHLGPSFSCRINGREKKFTGRHWWGTIAAGRNAGVEPLEGEEARTLAGKLGFPERSGGLTGTSIMILDFDRNVGDLDKEGPEDPEVTGNRIIEAILWNFWPRMMESTPPARRFEVEVEVEGRRLDLPSPEEFPPLDLFSLAMKRIRSGNDCTPVHSQKPAKLLGTMAIQKGRRSRRYRLVPDESIIPEEACHIALMRPVELVVKYLEGPPLPDESFEWGGVFRVSDEEEVERAFAESEPPAHDDWCASNLQDRRQKTFVNVALRELRKKAQEMAGISSVPPAGSEAATPLARVADRLGRILDSFADGGPGLPGGGGVGPSRPGVSSPGPPRPVFSGLEEFEGRVVAVFGVQIPPLAAREYKALKAEAQVLMDGKPERPDPEVMSPPQIIGFRMPGRTELLKYGDVIETASVNGRIEVLVGIPDDCAITLELQMIRESGHE